MLCVYGYPCVVCTCHCIANTKGYLWMIVVSVSCMMCGWLHLLTLPPPSLSLPPPPSLPLPSHIRCGPIFGAGADLYISSECNINMESYSNLLHSYGSPQGSVHSLASSYSFQIEDYEVFKPAVIGPYSTAI